jgi:hypothetical protein
MLLNEFLKEHRKVQEPTGGYWEIKISRRGARKVEGNDSDGQS